MLKLTGTDIVQWLSEDSVQQVIGTGKLRWEKLLVMIRTVWQERTFAGFNTVGTALTNPQFGYKLNRFTADIETGGSLTITGGSSNLGIETGFTGLSTVLNNRTYYLGQTFTNGVSTPEVKQFSGNIIYVDNRPSITRSSNQKEDIKIILQF